MLKAQVPFESFWQRSNTIKPPEYFFTELESICNVKIGYQEENAIKLTTLVPLSHIYMICFMHKFINFLIVCNWKSMILCENTLWQFSSASIFNLVWSSFFFLLSTLGGRQSALDANKLIIWMMSDRDIIFLSFFLCSILWCSNFIFLPCEAFSTQWRCVNFP